MLKCAGIYIYSTLQHLRISKIIVLRLFLSKLRHTLARHPNREPRPCLSARIDLRSGGFISRQEIDHDVVVVVKLRQFPAPHDLFEISRVEVERTRVEAVLFAVPEVGAFLAAWVRIEDATVKPGGGGGLAERALGLFWEGCMRGHIIYTSRLRLPLPDR